MFSTIMTWIGTVLGLGVLVAMAAGAFVVDVNDAVDALGDRRRKALDAPDGPTVAPL